MRRKEGPTLPPKSGFFFESFLWPATTSLGRPPAGPPYPLKSQNRQKGRYPHTPPNDENMRKGRYSHTPPNGENMGKGRYSHTPPNGKNMGKGRYSHTPPNGENMGKERYSHTAPNDEIGRTGRPSGSLWATTPFLATTKEAVSNNSLVRHSLFYSFSYFKMSRISFSRERSKRSVPPMM